HTRFSRDWSSDVCSSDLYEKNSAAYVQANFSGDSWSGNIGLRYVKTDSDIEYTQALPIGSGVPGAITGSAFGDYLKVTSSKDYRSEERRVGKERRARWTA